VLEHSLRDLAHRVEPTRGHLLRRSWREPGVLVCGVRSLAALAMRAWLHVYDRLTIVGRQNLPANRSYILIANHASHLDTLCLLSALPVRQLHRTFPVAASEYFCVNPLLSFFARLIVNVLPFDRQVACYQSLRVCAQLLQEKPGTILIFFPEGTRTVGIDPGEFKPGVALLVAGRDIPVVPCHLAGTHAALPKGAWFPRPKAVRLTIGAPRIYADLPANKQSRTRICRELREEVMSLGHADSRPELGL
jgi:1-acyl-sn-glycerol-3-phosphate acyltransferase